MKIFQPAILFLLMVAAAAWAASPPGLINYQGVLRDASGAPHDGTFDMVFRFYDALSTGTLLLTDSHLASGAGGVPVANGLFTAALGSGTLTPGAESSVPWMFANRGTVYLEIQVGAETLSPRIRILASAYAQNAGALQGFTAAAFAVTNHLQSSATGGTGLDTSSEAAGSMLYTSGTGTWAALPPGGNGQVLQLSGGLPQWGTVSGGNADSVDGFHASSTATANTLFPLDTGAKIPNARLYTGSGNGLDGDLLDGQHGSYYLTATNINAGTLGDARLSSNVAFLSGPQTFSGAKTFGGGLSWSGTATGSISGNADTIDGYHAGNASGQVALNSLTLNTNLNADLVDGYHAGTASGQIPLNSGILNTNLNADYLSGQHGSYYQNAGNINAGTLAAARGGTGIDTSAAAAGSILYTGGTGAWNVLGPGGNGQVLQVASGLPQWGTASGGNADTVDGYHAGNTSGTVAVSNGTVNSTFNADYVDGYHAGNASGQVALNNSTLNTNLQADSLDGVHGSYYLNAGNLNAGTLLDARLSSNVDLLNTTQTISGSKTFNANTYFPNSGIWNTSGNVGIGTTSAPYSLTIQGSQGVTQLISTGNTYGSVLELKNSMASPGYLGAINFNNAANGYPGQIAYTGANTMLFNTAGAERMQIGSTGNVGIGTTPLSDSRLIVQGTGTGYARLGYYDYGIMAYGSTMGGMFLDTFGGDYVYVGYDVYKVYGNGTAGFVQNHPFDKDKVIAYASPEGDEVATYTRGTAKLANGEARIRLGETFQWVTNPDIGLTAHITPRAKDAVLYVESVSPSELVVKSVTGFAPDAAFDYLVYGLRIGFEEISIVQDKQRESHIPSFKRHRDLYAKYPELRRYDSLERFKGMETAAGLRASFDFSASLALRDAIHEYDPAVDGPVDTDPPSNQAGPSAQPRSADLRTARSAASVEQAAPPASTPADKSVVAASAESPGRLIETVIASEAVEQGDVLVAEDSNPGRMRKCASPSDGAVTGVVQDSAVNGEIRARIVLSGITACRADAQYGPIQIGDLLVTSPTPGHAMKAVEPKMGTVIGKALEPLEGGTGTIRILVMLR